MRRKEIAELIEYLIELDEIQMMQRSRANWLKYGDRNASFFQAFASAWRKKNYVKRLKDGGGCWIEGMPELNNHILNYLTQLFSSEMQHTDPSILEKVQREVTEQMNNFLLAPFTANDVREAVWSIGDVKAPVPDGLHMMFFKRYWHLIGEDITKEVLSAINSRKIPDEWNDTTVVMIPKIDTPKLVTQFRHISLCSVLYKIISKM